MQSVTKTIKENKLFVSGDTIGIAVSGGPDSMALLDYFNKNKEKFDIAIVAIHLDHSIRLNSRNDADFVVSYCRENRIRLMQTRVDVKGYAQTHKQTLEQAARECRYNFFDSLVTRGVVDKIALGHHISDQAETILMHIFRGAGIGGAKGMDIKRGNYIRPMLNTDKSEILAYLNQNGVDYVLDESNLSSDYSRNFLRNEILPMIKEKYPNVERNIVNFGKSCSDDNEYILNQVYTDSIYCEKNKVMIPLNYFIGDDVIINRTIFKALQMLDSVVDIERKHIELIKDLALNCENGCRIDLPNNLTAIKEYEYITIAIKQQKVKHGETPFKSGTFEFEGFGKLNVVRTQNKTLSNDYLLIDIKKVPKNAYWRNRQDGDVFEKYGGGSKKLKSYLIDKKVPARLRDAIPVLASKNNVLVIPGIEISESVKIDDNTVTAAKITVL